jgi:aromatic-L-amino-acid decarboxylase
MTVHPLEPDRYDMEAMGRAALDLVADFVDGLREAPAVRLDEVDAVVAGLLQDPPEGPGEIDPLLDRVRRAASYAVETAGPGYMAYIPGGGLFTSAVGELLARVFNRYTGLSPFAPALVAMEESILRWLCAEFGLPAGSGGMTTTGGSLATLAAVVAARHDRLGEDFADGTLYMTKHTHRCVAKAARLAGLPTAALRTVPTTAELRMDPEALETMIRRDRAAGRRPFLLVASAGTTDTGAVDPLEPLAQIAAAEGLWNHVDAAYGGFFQLTERGRERFGGIEQADSLVLDPHKGLFLAYGTGVLLVRDPAKLQAAHAVDGAYLPDPDDAGALPDYAGLGPELTRDYRGLRLWLPLHLHGVGAFRQALDEKLDLARYAYAELVSDRRLEVPWEPELSTFAFRLRGDGEEAELANRKLLDSINATRRVYLSGTRVDGRQMVRVCVLSHRTHRPHIAAAIDAIRTAAG